MKYNYIVKRLKITSEPRSDMDELLLLCKTEKNVKQKKRYDAVLLHLEGYRDSEIGKVLHIPVRTVNDYVRIYKNGSISALLIKKQPGKPRKLTDGQEAELFRTISTSTPENEGLGPFVNWTAPLACRLVEKKYSVCFSERGMRDVFYRIGLSYTRPTYTLEKADPEKQAEFRKAFEGFKKTPE